MNLVFDISRKALVFGEKGMLAKYWKTPEKDTIDCIMKSDVKAARKILKDNEKVFKRIVSAAYGEDPVTLDVVFNVFFNGMKQLSPSLRISWVIGTWTERGRTTIRAGKRTLASISPRSVVGRRFHEPQLLDRNRSSGRDTLLS
jgi:hypothetical protein